MAKPSLPKQPPKGALSVAVSLPVAVARPLSPVAQKALIGLGLLLAAVPVWLYYQTVWQQAFNYPFEDDFNSLLTFINAFADPTASASQRLSMLVAQHNEHRIVFDRLIFLAQYYLGGSVNIRTLILIGNTSLLFLAVLLFKSSLRKLPLFARMLLFVPATYLLFTFHFWELTVWGMASIQNLFVLVFVLASFYLLCRAGAGRASFVAACGLAVLATYTSGNGLFAFPVGVLVLLILGQQRRSLVWAGVGIGTAVCYFWGFTRAEGLPNVYDSLVNNTGRAVDYFFTLTGSVVSANPAYPARAGKLMLLVYVGLVGYLLAKRQLREHLPLLAMLTFLYVTCALLTATRSGFGVGQAYSPRYGILSVLLVAGLGLLWLGVIRRAGIRAGAGVAFAAFSVWIFMTTYRQNLPKIADRARLLQFCAAFYNDDPRNLLVYWGTSQKEGQSILADSFKKKTYSIPAVTFADLASPPVPFTESLVATNEITAEAKPFESHGYVVFWNSWAVINGLPTDAVKTSLIAQGNGVSYAFATGKHIRYDVANQLQSADYAASGFSAVIKKADLKPGRYALWLHLSNGKLDSYLPLNQEIVN